MKKAVGQAGGLSLDIGVRILLRDQQAGLPQRAVFTLACRPGRPIAPTTTSEPMT
jgi:hypothetical protein